MTAYCHTSSAFMFLYSSVLHSAPCIVALSVARLLSDIHAAASGTLAYLDLLV